MVIASQQGRPYDRDSKRVVPEHKSGAPPLEPNDSVYEHLRNSAKRFAVFVKGIRGSLPCSQKPRQTVPSASSFLTTHHFFIRGVS
jgi:hypothetical protein